MLAPLMRARDTVVDFSCGANEWAPMLRQETMEHYTVRSHLPAWPGSLEQRVLESLMIVVFGNDTTREPSSEVCGLVPVVLHSRASLCSRCALDVLMTDKRWVAPPLAPNRQRSTSSRTTS